MHLNLGSRLSRLSNLHIFFILAIFCTGVYANSFYNSFQFDDITGILQNSSVHEPFKIGKIFNFWPTRFLNYWSISWNYLISGVEVFSYHIVQVTLHLANGFLVFLLIETLLKAVSWQGNARYIALTGSLVFLLHPVQSQPVNYISQRAVLLLSAFYLLSVLFYLRYRLGKSRQDYVFALVFMALAALSKEPAVTLPFMLIAMELVVLRGLRTESLRSRVLRLMPFVSVMALVSVLTMLRRANWGVDFTVVEADAARAGIGVWEYFLTEISVIKTYLRLFIFPVGQSFDYDYPIYRSFLNLPVALSAMLHAVLIGSAVYLARNERLKIFSMGILWFYIALSAESSFFPIFDVIFEHRMYLPLVGLSMSLSVLVFLPQTQWIKNALLGVLCLALFGLSILTINRNTVWRTETSLWENALKKAPNKERVRHMLGLAYKKDGRYSDAVKQFRAALAIGGKNCVRSKYELSESYFLAGQYEDSAREAREVLSLLYAGVGLPPKGPEPDGSIFNGSDAQKSLINRFGLWEVHTNLGTALLKAGRAEEAITEYRRALYLKPELLDARNQLGLALMDIGRYEEAASEFKKILEISPNFALAHESLAIIYLENLPDAKKARYHIEKLLSLMPEHPSREWFIQKFREIESGLITNSR